MKATTAVLLGLLVLGPAADRLAAQTREADKGKAPQPELVLVRMRAADDGSVLDVDFVNTARGRLVQTSTDLMRRHLTHDDTQPVVALDWEKVVTDGLVKLRKDQGLGDQTEVKIAADDHLDFGAAMAAVACCRKAGFQLVDFTEGNPSRVVIVIDADGKLTVDGQAVSALEVKTHLVEVARTAGGPGRVSVIVRAHPQTKYASVFRWLKDLKEAGFRATEVSSQAPQ